MVILTETKQQTLQLTLLPTLKEPSVIRKDFRALTLVGPVHLR